MFNVHIETALTVKDVSQEDLFQPPVALKTHLMSAKTGSWKHTCSQPDKLQ